jgi:hypothetical protein
MSECQSCFLVINVRLTIEKYEFCDFMQFLVCRNAPYLGLGIKKRFLIFFDVSTWHQMLQVDFFQI